MLRSLTTATCALAALAGGAAGGAPHAGKVVRLERRPKLVGSPRVCMIAPARRSGSCIGPKPEPGDHVLMLDSHRTLATLRVSAVQPLAQCPQLEAWAIKTQIESGDLDAPVDQDVQSLLDVDADPRRAHLVKVDHLPADQPMSDDVIGIDIDGDDTADLAFDEFNCDEDRRPSSAATNGTCIAAWYAVDGRWKLLRVDRVHLDCP